VRVFLFRRLVFIIRRVRVFLFRRLVFIITVCYYDETRGFFETAAVTTPVKGKDQMMK
jgi:hypothetical protein